jgi:hypothetical protein
VIVAGAATNTNQLTLSSTNLASRSTNVTIGENNITEVTFTNQDPPGVSTATGGSSTGGSSTGGSSTGGSSTGGSTAASTGGGGATSGGSTAASTGGGGSVAASLTPPTVAGTGIVVGATTGSGTTGAVTQLKNGVSVATLRKELATNKAMLKKLLKQKAAATTLARKHVLGKQIAALQAKDLKLATAIKRLA